VSGATVLIADDSLVIRAVVRAGLESEGYQVVEAVDGAAALDRCRRQPPDVVLLDIEMPGLDGYEVLAQLKADPDLKDIPIVFLTSRTGMDDVVAGLRGGAHDYLKKPFEPPELLARVASAVHVKKLQDQLRERNVQLDEMSRTDALTGLYNRRHLDDELARRHSDARRHGEAVSVIILDIDHFKKVNDGYGHPAGDLVLRDFAGRLIAQLRTGDVAGRWGGEEFLVILPRTALPGAHLVADRIREAVAATPFLAGDEQIRVTVSGGCATGPVASLQDLVSLADTCLYEAKDRGRDQIVATDGNAGATAVLPVNQGAAARPSSNGAGDGNRTRTISLED
jgi:two-component system, cell cycle response regulator